MSDLAEARVGAAHSISEIRGGFVLREGRPLVRPSWTHMSQLSPQDETAPLVSLWQGLEEPCLWRNCLTQREDLQRVPCGAPQ